MDQREFGVHQSHCCVLHGCKYGDEDCPVVNRVVMQEYTCEYCDDEDYEVTMDVIREKFEGATWYIFYGVKVPDSTPKGIVNNYTGDPITYLESQDGTFLCRVLAESDSDIQERFSLNQVFEIIKAAENQWHPNFFVDLRSKIRRWTDDDRFVENPGIFHVKVKSRDYLKTLSLNDQGKWEIDGMVCVVQGNLEDMMDYMEVRGWVCKWTHANGKDYIFRKIEEKNTSTE